MSEINTQTDGTVRIRKAVPDQTNKQINKHGCKKKNDAYSLQAQKCEVRMPLPSLTYGFQPVQKKKSMQRPLIHLLSKSIFTWDVKLMKWSEHRSLVYY